MNKPLHPLLQYQLGKHLDNELLKNPGMKDFIAAINQVYAEHITDQQSTNNTSEGTSYIQSELGHLSLVASLNKNGVVFTDIRGRITWYNEAFSTLTGYVGEEIIGKTPVELLKGPETDMDALRRMLDLFYSGKAFEPELLCYRKDGTTFWARCSGQAITDANGAAIEFFAIVEDITASKLAEDVLRLQEEKYRNIIANMNLGLIEVDIDEKIQYVNNSFCEMCGYEREELLGKNPWMLFARNKDQELMEVKNELRKKGISDAYEITVKDKKGAIKWWLISAAPRYNDKGELVGSTGIHLDITDQKYMEDALVSSWEQAEESSRAKENFLANMSHEMRTPMNAIMGMALQLEKTNLSDSQQFYLQNIITASENLLVIMNDILDISKIEAGQLVIEALPFRLRDVVNQVLRMHELKAEEKEIELKQEMDDSIAPELIGDPFRLQQILVNLVGNAIKFTTEGSVSVECTVSNDKASEQEIVIKVKDTGSGIDPDYLTRIFEKFSQEDRSIARKFGGTGLGMSIVKNLTELLGGSIAIESEQQVGTTVIVTLPFEKSGARPVLSIEEPEHIADLTGKKVLLVEDNEMNTLVAKMLLQQYGIEVTEAGNGIEAVEAVKNNNFDLILMDIQMPQMDGLEATRIIRQELKSTTPIVALTAHALKGEAEKCLNAGMNDFLSKPYRENVLLGMLEKWIRGDAAPVTEQEVKKRKSGFTIDIATLETYSAGDPEFMQSLISVFCRQTPIAMVEMQRGFEEREFELMSAAAHRIKPSLEIVGATEAGAIALEIEHWDKHSRDDKALQMLLSKLSMLIDDAVAQLRDHQTQASD